MQSPARVVPKTDPAAAMHATVYHIDNLLWHAGSVVALFLLMYRMTGRRWESAAIALLWAVHPLRVESVAWVTERKDVLAMFWGLMAIHCYATLQDRRQAGRSAGWAWHVAMLAAFCLSLMAKAMFVILPCLLLLLDFWPLGRMKSRSDIRRLAWEKIPLVLIAVGVSLVTLWAQSNEGAVKGLGQVGLIARLENSALSYVQYLIMQVYCWNLGALYPFAQPARPKVVAAVVLLLALTWFCVWQQRRPAAMADRWMVLVSRDACASHRNCAGRRPGVCRSVHLFADGRAADNGGDVESSPMVED